MTDLRNEIRQAIIDGAYAPGQRLIESDLCERYAASRFMVRSVLQELAGSGLVELQHNRGARVRSITHEQALQILEIRWLLEGYVAARAAERATDEQIRELRDCIEGMREAESIEQNSAYRALNTKLHERMRAIAGHDVAAEMLQGLYGRTARHGMIRSIVPGGSRASLEEYATIVEAIAAHDPEAAAAAAHAHIERLMVRGEVGSSIALQAAVSEGPPVSIA